MKFTVETKELLKGLFVKNVISNNASMPILKTFKLTCNDEGLEFTGSDGDITMTSFVPRVIKETEIVEINRPGSILLPSLFNDIAKKLPGEKTTIEVSDNNIVSIKSKKSRFTLNGIDAEEYPRNQFKEDAAPLVFTGAELSSIFNQTLFAASDNSTRPSLAGINMVLESDRLLIQATDSYRFARKDSPFAKPVAPFNIIIPKKTMKELLKVMDTEDKEVEIHINDNQILFKTEKVLMYSRLLEGKFPNVSQLIPTLHNTVLQIDKMKFNQAIERATVLEEAGKSIVKFVISPSSLVIDSNQIGIGKLTEEIEIQSFEGDELTISFNGKYLKEAFKSFKGDIITIKLNGPMKPAVLLDSVDENYLQLILPIRTY
ncbi:DNA polymerase III subunit beta [Bacillus thuringiensis]|uniref:DNA polymerase III subunit beta n=1 Tax=Bacillus thuringiensis TaxID=1428 RepID=UPI0021D64BD9|nr:DNA polymerase III subunit beta [Bacillus thuringiensis]MCU7667394.1 DNA polymerase III subunit beta [Bacillus thuringiensis]